MYICIYSVAPATEKIDFYKGFLKIEKNGEYFIFKKEKGRTGQVGFSESPPNFVRVSGSR